jgi:hypothetical protein
MKLKTQNRKPERAAAAGSVKTQEIALINWLSQASLATVKGYKTCSGIASWGCWLPYPFAVLTRFLYFPRGHTRTFGK